jgi:HTH-type transcriptional regulator, sugar sensing transcriptional regulator
MVDEDDMKIAVLQETLKENVGMSKYETDVYLALVRGGAQTMSNLAQTSGVPKQRVYDTVEDLRDQGFVEIIDDYPREAYAVEPSEALADVQSQLARAEEYLEEFHETVEDVESGVALFKSKSTIIKYIEKLIDNADHDIFILCPQSLLGDISEYLDTQEEKQVRLIISDLAPESLTNDQFGIDRSLFHSIDAVRGVASTEDFILTTDRDKGMFWSRSLTATSGDEEEGFYITNPQLALILDRFISESVWPFARSLSTDTPSLPQRYIRIRDCLSDLSRLTNIHPLHTIEVEFEGHKNETGEPIHQTGTLDSYYYTEYDIRASLTVNIGEQTDDIESPLVTVGGLESRTEDYNAHTIILRQANTDLVEIDEETCEHLSSCQLELPTEFGTKSVVTGFDAFVDRMRKIVGNWSDGFESVDQFDEFKESILSFEASESAPRIQWTQTKTEAGGHVAHTSRVFDALGYDITLIGQIGTPIRSEFTREFRDQSLVSVGDTTTTEFVEFADRKFLFTEPNPNPLTWETILDHVDAEELAEYLDGTALLTLGTLFATPTLPSLLENLREELWPTLNSPPENILFSTGAIDQFPPSKVRACYEELGKFDKVVPITITANRKQTRCFRDLFDGAPGTYSKPTVQRVREGIGVTRYIMHTNAEAVLAREDDVLTAQAPQVVKPRQMRNVDEHFVSGISLGLAEDLSDGALLVIGNSIASYYMHHNRAPGPDELRSFISEYDAFFDG